MNHRYQFINYIILLNAKWESAPRQCFINKNSNKSDRRITHSYILLSSFLIRFLILPTSCRLRSGSLTLLLISFVCFGQKRLFVIFLVDFDGVRLLDLFLLSLQLFILGLKVQSSSPLLTSSSFSLTIFSILFQYQMLFLSKKVEEDGTRYLLF